MPNLPGADPAPWDAAAAAEVVAAHRDLDGPLLPVLHALADRFGYIDDAAIPLVADALNLSQAEVFGVVGFYRDFRRAPPARRRVALCRAEACQAMGVERVAAAVEAALGLPGGGTTPDGTLALERAFCLGNCALAPAALVDGKLYGRIDAPRLVALARGSAR